MRVLGAVKKAAFVSVLVAGASLALAPLRAEKKGTVAVWLTTPDKSALFSEQSEMLKFNKLTDDSRRALTIDVDERQPYQPIDGFGFALTGGSAQLLMGMTAGKRTALLQELFGTEGNGIGVSYVRLSIGASDLSSHLFSYDDLPAGQTDPEMKRFTLQPDKVAVIPLLKEILAINPKLKVMASPWSAPAWMKTNGALKGGTLKPEFYPAYAKYFVKYVQGMRDETIVIDAVTVQHEPLNDRKMPSMLMSVPEEAAFIKDHLGPAFQAANLRTKILIHDQSCDAFDYPLSILSDPGAAQYIDGSVFRVEAGDIEAMSEIHTAHADKNLYLAGQAVPGSVDGVARIDVATPVRKLIVGAVRNWSRNVLLGNLAANSKNEPRIAAGSCPSCQGALTIDGDNVTRNLAYYCIAHAARFVRPGSARIPSTNPETLPNVAFKTPTGERVLIVVNGTQAPQQFNIRFNGKAAIAKLGAGAVGTYVW
jgi:glucosylceramidase